MTARKEDSTPPPPGGRAAERLREFEEARGLRPPKRQSRTSASDASGSEAPGHNTSGDAEKPRDAEPKPPKPPKP
jgi:hypothetical protein